MNSSDTTFSDLSNSIFKYIYQYVVPVFYVVGNIGNLLSALVFSKKTWRKNVCVLYFNVCLIFHTCCINSYVLATILILGYNSSLYNSSAILCKLYYYTAFLFMSLFPTVLILASIDRLLISSQNVDTRLYSSKRLAYFSISISTFIWIVFCFHTFIKTNVVIISPGVSVCSLDTSEVYVLFIAYSSVIMTSLFCFTMIILLVFAFKNVHRIQAIPRQQRHQIRSMTKKDFQLLRCLFAHDILYIICNFFLNVYYAYAAARITQVQTPLEEAISSFFRNFLTFLQQISFCVSFFIFILVSKAFRNELKRMIYKMVGKNLNHVREEENHERDNVELNVVHAIVLSA